MNVYKNKVPSGMCAVLYDDDGCEGWELPVPEGYTKLEFNNRNDAEAVVVNKGCILTGWDHDGEKESERGEKAIFDGRNFDRSYNYWKNLDRDSLNDKISAVTCECTGLSTGGLKTNSSGSSGKTDPNSNVGNCEDDDFKGLVINPNEERSFSLLKSPLNLKYKNEIESFSVRDGCTLEAYNDSDFSDDGIRATASNGDLHVNLDDHPNKKYDNLDGEIESVKFDPKEISTIVNVSLATIYYTGKAMNNSDTAFRKPGNKKMEYITKEEDSQVVFIWGKKLSQHEGDSIFPSGLMPLTFECTSSSTGGLKNNSSSSSGKTDPNSNVGVGICPPVPETACAVLYDDKNCEEDGFKGLYINPSEERSFSNLKSYSNLKYTNEIESFSVRDGCTLEAYNDSDFSYGGIRASASNGDLHINLDDHPNKKYDDLDGEIESVRCLC
ncbi:unnamed protein product [Lepeophtheirus salmonis]|uniref:(salmon louse) hypothetical protein n=1 Tax=Lepeophtheirus salmonis TaxID=72036 RepID=A0A7R8H7H3_LEPSM|nr:unnamed protein product [Lepeophtheirus salmonis]CAF2923358.1 unnamed protein product [Lepeophtheirus salmonis]